MSRKINNNIPYQQQQQQQQNDNDNQWITVTKTKTIKKYKQSNSSLNTINNHTKKSKIIWEKGAPVYIQQNQQYDQQQFINSQAYICDKKLIQNKLRECILQIINNDSNNNNSNNNGNIGIIQHIHIQCLGLGNFINYYKPRHQYNFLKLLLIPLCHSKCNKLTINIYDPVFTEQCIKQTNKYGTHNQYKSNYPNNDNNSNCKMLKIFFMPHCQQFLYKLVCKQQNNQNRNHRFIMIGNSLLKYIERSELLRNKSIEQEEQNNNGDNSVLFKQICSGQFYKQQKVKDYRQCLNDTYLYVIFNASSIKTTKS